MRREADGPADVYTPVDPTVLNTRVRIGRQADGDSWRSTLIVEICGTIEAPDDDHEVRLQVSLSDVTDAAVPPLPVLNRPKNGPLQTSSLFAHQSAMGKLCHRTTTLGDWTVVAQLSPEWFVLPRQGSRRLQSDVAILSQARGQRLASARCITSFESVEVGYLDIEDNIQRAKTLAVGLAFSVAAADNELPESEVLVIEGWVRTNFGAGQASPTARSELDRAMQKTATFFRRGGRLNLDEICREIVEIAPMIGRIEIMDLCLRVAGAKGQVTGCRDAAPEATGGLSRDRPDAPSHDGREDSARAHAHQPGLGDCPRPYGGNEPGAGPPPVEPRVRQVELPRDQLRPRDSQAGRPDA